MSDFLEQRKIVHLPGTLLTPEVVLSRTQEKLPRIKAVAVVILWDDDSVDIDWSNMKVSEFCFATARMEVERDNLIVGVTAPFIPGNARDA